MTNKIKIVIPNIEELDSEQYDILISTLETLPLDYERWDCVEEKIEEFGEDTHSDNI